MPSELSKQADRLRTVEEVSEYLATSTAFVRREISEGRLLAYQVGAGVRVATRDLEEYLEARRKSGPNPLRDPRRNGKRAGRRAVSK